MRISIFVDGSNFFYAQKNKLGWWIDIAKLMDFIATKGQVVDAFYYVGTDPDPEKTGMDGFSKVLTNVGYALVTKPLKTIIQDDGTLKQKANLDIEIVLDMFNTIDNYDMAVLISGDGDFERSLQMLRARGKRFLVMSTYGLVARELREVAGMHYIDFEDIREQIEKTD
jgi:uncharacterized LabA/DUF88 family protein